MQCAGQKEKYQCSLKIEVSLKHQKSDRATKGYKKMTVRESWDLIRSWTPGSLRSPSSSGHPVILWCPHSSNSCSADKPAGITHRGSVEIAAAVEGLGCSWQTLGSFANIIWKLVQGLIPLTKVPSAIPRVCHMCLWRGGLQGRAWRCFADWRNQQVSVHPLP